MSCKTTKVAVLMHFLCMSIASSFRLYSDCANGPLCNERMMYMDGSICMNDYACTLLYHCQVFMVLALPFLHPFRPCLALFASLLCNSMLNLKESKSENHNSL